MFLVVGTPSARLARFATIAAIYSRDPSVRVFARELRAEGGCPMREAHLLHRVLCDLPTRADPAGPVDLVRSPRDVLRGGGDCDCKAVLCAATWEVLGGDSRLVWLDAPEHAQDHLAVELLVSGAWYWCETTVAAWFGEHPSAAARRLGKAAI